MLFKIFTIYDQKAKAHLPPFFLPEEGQAIRQFIDCVNNPEHPFGAHPEDYTLKNIGIFNDINAHIEKFDTPVNIGSGESYKT